MKKMLKKIGIGLVILLILMFTLPFMFSGLIKDRLNKEINERINIELSYEDLSLSLFSNFPNLTLNLENVSLVGKEFFPGDTLLYTNKVSLAANVFKAVVGNIEVSKVIVQDGKGHFIKDKEENVNWDILKKDTLSSTQNDTSPEEKEKESSFKVSFDNVVLKNFSVLYLDRKSKMKVGVLLEKVKLKGSFEDAITSIESEGELKSFNFYDGATAWVKDIPIFYKVILDADFNKNKFTFDKKGNTFTIGKLPLSLEGEVEIREDEYYTDLQVLSKKADLETLLHFIPKKYLKYETVNAKGQLDFHAKIRGVYKDNHLPAFNVKVGMKDGYLKFPEREEAITDVNFHVLASNKGGSADNTVIDMKEVTLKIANNPLRLNFYMTTPVSDPAVSGALTGKVFLDRLKAALPMESIEKLKGILNVNVAFEGRMSDFDKAKYNRIKTSGNVDLQKFYFSSTDFSKGITINNALMELKPQHIILKKCNVAVGQSHINLSGEVSNYFQYILKGKPLNSDFDLYSKNLNVKDFIGESMPRRASKEAKGKDEQEKESDSRPVKVPENISLKLNVKIDNILYDKMNIKDVKGQVKVASSTVSLNNLAMKVLDGAVKMSGLYNTPKDVKPNVKMQLNIKKIDLQRAYEQISIIKEMMPVASTATGKLSTNLSFTSDIDNHTQPIRKTIDGNGKINLKNIRIQGNKVFHKVAMLVGNKELERIYIPSLNIDYKISKGKLIVAPFKVKLAGRETKVFGTYDADDNMDFSVSMKIDRNEIKGKIGNIISKLPGSKSIKELDVGLKITGKANKPVVTPDIKSISKQLIGAITSGLLDNVKDKLMGGKKDSLTNNKEKKEPIKDLINNGLKDLFKKKKGK